MMTIAELKARVAQVERRVAVAHTAASGLDLVTVRRVVAAELGAIVGVAPEHVAETHSLTHNLGLSALGRVELAVALEERLGVARLSDAPGWVTVGDVVREVMRAQPGR